MGQGPAAEGVPGRRKHSPRASALALPLSDMPSQTPADFNASLYTSLQSHLLRVCPPNLSTSPNLSTPHPTLPVSSFFQVALSTTLTASVFCSLAC